MSTDLFSSFKLGDLTLANRIIMAPLTRNRAAAGNVPQAMNVDYYCQRANAGLIITEASQVSPEGVGYPATPGIYSDAQVAGWRKVTDAVHNEGGRSLSSYGIAGEFLTPACYPINKLPSLLRRSAPRVRPSPLQACSLLWSLARSRRMKSPKL